MARSTELSFTALSLKVAGIILILSALLDYVLLPWMIGMPLDLGDPQWRLSFVSQMVDRGVTPLIGAAFCLIAYGLEAEKKASGSPVLSLKFWAIFLSTLLGILFILFIPVYLTNLGTAQSIELEKLEQGVGEFENRLQQEYDQLTTVLQNEEQLQQVDSTLAQLNEALETGKVNGQPLTPQDIQQLQTKRVQFEQLKQFKENPQALEARIKELQGEIRSQKSKQEKQAKNQVFKQGLRIGLRSLLLGVGYLGIGWFGWQAQSKSF